MSYLETVSPHTVKTLKNSFPYSERLFSSEMEFGAEGTADKATLPPDRSARISLLKESAPIVTRDVEQLVGYLRKRLKLVQKIRLGGGVIAAITGCISAVTALIGKQKGWPSEGIILGSSITTTVGGLLTLVADYFERSPTGQKFGGTEELTGLVETRCAIEKIVLQLSRDTIIPLSDAEIGAAISLLDEVSLKILRLKYLSIG
jgi:hypothetical protein